MEPKYIQIKNTLKNDIESKKYRPGDQLPTESELMDLWQMSRITIRRALMELANDGFSYTVHGKGTYVAEPKISNRLPNLTSFSRDVEQQGKVPFRKVLDLKTIKANSDVTSKLKIIPDDHVIYFRRLMLADDIPISLSDTYVPVSAITPYQNRFAFENLENRSFYQLLKDINCELYGGDQVITATCADVEQARLLTVEYGSALIMAERIAYNKEKIIVEYSKMYSRPDLIQWRVNLNL